MCAMSERPQDAAHDLTEVDVVYKEADDYRVVPGTGVRGGVQAAGNVRVDFYVDYQADPEYERFEVSDEGLGDMVERGGELKLVREKQVAVNLNQRDALSIGAWLAATVLGPQIEEEDVLRALSEEYPDVLEFPGED